MMLNCPCHVIERLNRHVKLKPLCGPQNDIQRLKNGQRAAVWKYFQLFFSSEAFSYQNMSVLSTFVVYKIAAGRI
jgi:hypothetical protein